MSRSTTVAFATLALIAQASAQLRPPCSPATHCPDLSIECFRCNVRVEEDTCGLDVTSLGSPKFTEPGFCVETSTLDFKGKVFQQEVHERCATMLDPAHRQIPEADRIPTYSYQKACKQLELTCADGFCASLHGLPSECYSGYTLGDFGPCDVENNLEMNELITNLLFTAENQAACQDHGGFRYDYLRCNSPLLPEVSDSSCGVGSTPVTGGVCQDRIVPTAIPVEGDYCNDECTDETGSVDVNSCCLPVDDELPCDTVTIYKPEEVVPPPHGDDERNVIDEATGLIVNLNLEHGNQNCCCEIQCQCFGDPHCSSFFGDYEVSQQSNGDFIMYEEGGYRLATQVDSPGGIIAKAFLTTSDGAQYQLDARECIGTAAPGKGVKVITGDGPEDFYYLNEKNPDGTYVHTGPPGFQRHESVGTTNEEWTIDPAYATFVDGTTTTQFRCMLFYQGLGPRSRRGWYSRMDVSIKKTTNSFKYATTDDICCATNSEVKQHLLNNGAGGFCVRDANDPGTFIPGAIENGEPIGNRRLRTTKDNESKEEFFVSTYDRVKRRGLSEIDPEHVSKCEEAGYKTEEEIAVCLQLIEDFGIETIEKEIEAQALMCRKYSNHNNGETFSVQHKLDNPCLDGVYFEVRKVDPPGQDWTQLHFFPVDETYCNGQVIIDFMRTKVGEEYMNLKDWEMRLRSCPIPRECDPERCFPTLSMRSEATIFTLPCIDSKINSEYFEKAIEHCKCQSENVSQCIEDCYLHGDCPAESCDSPSVI